MPVSRIVSLRSAYAFFPRFSGSRHLEIEIAEKRWVVEWPLVTAGDGYQTRRGKWVRELKPRVRRYLEKRLEWARALGPGIPERDRAYWVDHYEWVLERNGWP